MLKYLEGYKLNEAIGRQEKIIIKGFSSAKTDHMNSHAVPTTKRNPKTVIFHCGTNDIRSKNSPEEISREVIELVTSTTNDDNKIYVSSIVQRGDDWNEKVKETNSVLVTLRDKTNRIFINNDNTNSKIHLNRSNLHLNREGTGILANNFLGY